MDEVVDETIDIVDDGEGDEKVVEVLDDDVVGVPLALELELDVVDIVVLRQVASVQTTGILVKI